ncbi:MAG: cytochrome ubiquinol oxidase subunit I [Sedimenticolaceae bacterium]
MTFDPLVLARIQFAANISFHIIFPMISIALTWMLLFFKLRYKRTGEACWMDIYRLFVKVFALTFALGVVSGVTMSFQFGTNWPGFMETVGNIAGPLLAYEVLTAFFLEAAFLGIMLYGFNRVSNRVHTLATCTAAETGWWTGASPGVVPCLNCFPTCRCLPAGFRLPSW